MKTQFNNGPSREATANSLRIAALTGLIVFSIVPQALTADSWTQKTDMPTARAQFGACAVNGTIYAIGGSPYTPFAPPLRTVEAYDAVTDSWNARSDMPTARAFMTAEAVNGKIYVIGGGVRVDLELNTVEEYDPDTDTWTRKADMPTARTLPASAVVDGKIYVIGGLIALNATPTVEVYDPASNTWERKAPMPTPRGALGAAAVDGKIFAIGGASSSPDGPWLDIVEVYNPLTNRWTRKADMPGERGALKCVAAYGKIYAIGGRSNITAFAKCEEYNPVTDTWTPRADLPTTLLAFGASEVNGRIYAIGGRSQEPQGGNTVPSLASVFEYTPPLNSPQLQISWEKKPEQNVVRLKWSSRADCVDSLQSRWQLGPGDWTDVQTFPGTGDPITAEIPALESNAFYRLLRELK